MRVGQKNSLVRQWAPKGSRPRQVKDLRTSSAYLFGAICPERGEGAALVMPRANTESSVKNPDFKLKRRLGLRWGARCR